MIFKGSHSPAGQFDAVAAAVLRPIERLLPADAATKQEHLQAVARGVADYVCSESTAAAAGPAETPARTVIGVRLPRAHVRRPVARLQRHGLRRRGRQRDGKRDRGRRGDKEFHARASAIENGQYPTASLPC